MRSLMTALALLTATAVPAAAQTPKIEDDRSSVGVGFVLLKWHDFETTTKGIGVDFSKPIRLGTRQTFSIVADLTWARSGDETNTTIGGGVRYTLPGSGKTKVHVQGLLGSARWSLDGGSDSSFYVAPGAGVLFPLNDSVALKSQLDIFLPSWDVGNLYRFWFGASIRLGQR